MLENNLSGNVALYVNHEGETRNSLRLEVRGMDGDRFAVGARVDARVDTFWQMREVLAGGNGYLGQNELILHVGLDQTTVVDQAIVRWPSAGPTRVLTNLPANEVWSIYPPSRLCDLEGDAVVGHTDFVGFSGCFVSDFVPGCEMMDSNGNSEIYVDDLLDCFAEYSADCNGNGTDDLIELLFDAGLDADGNEAIDCCSGGPTPFPNSVGSTLRLGRDPSGSIELVWDAPAADATHDAPDTYDVYASTAGPSGSFGLRANVTATSHTEPVGPDGSLFYVVGARNGCGTSGEEPF